MATIIKDLIVTVQAVLVRGGLHGWRRTLTAISRCNGRRSRADRPRGSPRPHPGTQTLPAGGLVIGVPLAPGEWVQSHIDTLFAAVDHAPDATHATLTVYRATIGPNHVLWEHQADTVARLRTASTWDRLAELLAAWPLPVPADVARNRTRRINGKPGRCRDCGDGVPIAQGRLHGFGSLIEVSCWPPRCRRRRPAVCPITEPHCGFCRTTLAVDGWVQVRNGRACGLECAALMLRRRGSHDALCHAGD